MLEHKEQIGKLFCDLFIIIFAIFYFIFYDVMRVKDEEIFLRMLRMKATFLITVYRSLTTPTYTKFHTMYITVYHI